MTVNQKFTNSKIFLRILCVVYSFVFHLVCINWLIPIYGYFGRFEVIPLDISFLCFTFFLSIFPALFLPQNINRPSETYLWYIFTLAYVPMIYVPLYKGLVGFEYFNLSISLFLGFLIIISQRFIKKYPIQFFSIKEENFKKPLLLLTILFSFFVLYQTRGNLRFVNLFDSSQVMEQRTNENIELGYALYPFVFLTSIFFPFWLVYGVVKKEYKYIILGVVGHLVLFMVYANKAIVLSFIMYSGIWMLIKNNTTFTKNLMLFFIISLGVLVSSQLDFTNDITKQIFFIPAFMFGIRLVGISTLNFGLYYDFFNEFKQPFTNYSHINIVGTLVKYPYDRPLGQAVANYIMGTERFNPNACFWITDGFAAMGNYGIIIISIIFSVFLYFLDCMTQNQNLKFSVILLASPSIYFLNTSFFTTLLTGGLLILVFILNSIKISTK